MMPVGPLMKEHRLIERMKRIMNINVENIRKENKVEPLFIDTVVDFFGLMRTGVITEKRKIYCSGTSQERIFRQSIKELWMN